MADLDRIVTVNITRNTVTPTQAAFNGILIAAEFLKSKTTTPFSDTERVRSYGSLVEMTSDGWTTSDFVYKAASAIFNQNPAVNQVFVGRKLTGADGTETWAAAIAAMALYSADWYGFVSSSRTTADQEALADWAETNKKFYMIASSDADILTTSNTTNIAYYIKNKNYIHSSVWYSPNAGQTSEDCIDAAEFGKLFPYAPGSSTYAYKTLAGVSVYTLTTSQINAAFGYNANVYTSIAGVACTQMGTVGSGEYIDVIIGLDWLESHIQSNVFTVLVNNQKVPFTDDGVQMIVNPLKAALADGVSNGVLSGAPGDTNVTFPIVSSVSSANKSARTLPNVNFTGVLAGAIHKTQINGTVTY